MTRRQALVAGGTILAGYLQTTNIGALALKATKPLPISFSFEAFSTIEFRYKGRKVKVTPEELMDALEGKV